MSGRAVSREAFGEVESADTDLAGLHMYDSRLGQSKAFTRSLRKVSAYPKTNCHGRPIKRISMILNVPLAIRVNKQNH